MTRQAEFVGGPHDGLALSTGLGTPFLWSDGKRCFRAPARGRSLYRLMGQSSVGLAVNAMRYRYVGGTYGLCECGVYRQKRRPCQMCGSEVLAG